MWAAGIFYVCVMLVWMAAAFREAEGNKDLVICLVASILWPVVVFGSVAWISYKLLGDPPHG